MSPQQTRKLKILVVDDEPDNLDLLYRTFHRDYKVLRANSGPEALELLAQEGEVAVIISDQRMPLMSGTEFLSLTASQYPDTIRIILTGYTDVEDLVEAINSGKVFKYVTKPWEAEDLKAVVKQATDTHNVLKSRTEELRRALRQESLLYAVTNTIRSAPNYRDMLQRIVETVGQMFDVSSCLLRPFQEGQMADEWFIYERHETKNNNSKTSRLTHDILPLLVWETTDVEVIQDVRAEDSMYGPEFAERKAAYEKAGVCSSLIVPLFYRLELIAVLALHQFDLPHVWQDHEVQLVITVADQAALALSQARSYEQVRALAKREALVNTITSAIRSTLDPKSIFAAITQQLGQGLHVDGCALSLWTSDDEYVQCVGLYDANVDEVEVRDWEEEDSPSPVKKIPPLLHSSLPQSLAPIRGNPVLQSVLDTREPIAIPDLQKHPEYNQDELALRNPARALLVVPLLSDGRIIGSISLRQNHAPRHWQTSDIELAQAVATQASIAVQQSRLYQTTRQQAEKLLEADRLKTEFFQNISHEFRTPLTLMLGPLETACNRKSALPYEQAAIALRNARRLLRLVNQLLDLQKLDAGRMQPSFRPCDLVGFCRSIVESFSPYCEKKGISLMTHLKDCPALFLDVERFDKVIYNLLSNAVKFTPAGGSITLSVESIGSHCLLQVKDTGIGIRQDQIPYLFERFRQAEGSASRSYEGTGLGLALVKELVELHHGQISVDSTYKKGTTFTIWLHFGTTHLPPEQVLAVPAELQLGRAAVELADIEMDLSDIQANGVPDEPQSLILGSQYPTVLIVDDNPDLRRYVSHIISDSGFNVLLARNALEGFEVAKSHRPDLIVTDLMMPQVSGLDLIRMIRETDELRGVPVILLTAKADEDTRIEGVEQGADAYLSKPFNDRELLAEVRNLLALKDTERRVQQLNNYLTESVLRRFLPPMMVKKAAMGDLSLDLRPEPRLITILFSDIVGFTVLANRLQARGISEVLNEYLGEMTQAIFDNGGTVDKFVGDAVMALFGAPEDLAPDEQVKRAIRSARQMLRSLDKLNSRWEKQGIVGGETGVSPVRFRCGIHQGYAVVGMFGGVLRSDYTAIGPSVNVAARLQEIAEPNSILVSPEVAAFLDEGEMTVYKPLHLKGFDDDVSTFLVHREPST
jgi:signal transduction histidine kinase/response regulator RpfG family c-di-GMP phosphodiesterase